MRISLMAALAGLALLTSCMDPADSADGKAVKLKPTEEIRTALGDAYWRYLADLRRAPARNKIVGPEQVYYGKIAGGKQFTEDVYWAMGSIDIKGDRGNDGNGLHVWRKVGNGPWKYRGGDYTCPTVPGKLLKAWNRADLICRD
ncbi:hypothetical protein GCM10010517_62460 [Streptosporangium fragile]|uniref:DUF995 domain-containing protein n=1 Tax=Streptosporangium fragile TaxID=46186 RepID=A0ABN3W5Y2_9ACTN